MTCIIAIKDGSGGVLMGADSAVTHGCGSRAMAGSKLVRHGEFLMGIAGGGRACQVVQHGFFPPPTDNPDLGYMATAFSDKLMRAFDAFNVAPPDGHGQGNHFDILVAVRGQLYEVNTDFHVGAFPEPFAAVGCGAPYAMGALEALRNGEMGLVLDHETVVKVALRIASKYSTHVLPPYVFETLPAYVPAPRIRSPRLASKVPVVRRMVKKKRGQ